MSDDADKPWRRLFHGTPAAQQQQQQQPQQEQQVQQQQQQAQQQEQQQQQQQQQADQQQEPQRPEEALLQQQLLAAYRKTCIVAGLGMAGAIWRWRQVGRHAARDVFLPPRAQALPPQVVEAWKTKAELREALRTIGRQSLFITGIAGIYFGTELGVGLARGQPGDWANTAAAGALAGGFLGARVPSSMRGRALAVGSVVGGLMGGLSGWSQQMLSVQQLAAEDGSLASSSSSSSSDSSQPPGGK